MLLVLGLAAPGVGAAPPKSLSAAERYATPAGQGWTDFEYAEVPRVAAQLGVNLRTGSASQQDRAFYQAQTKVGQTWPDAAPITSGMWHEADIDWDFSAQVSGGTPLEGYGLRRSFQMGAIQRRLTKCGYVRRHAAGATLMSARGLGFLQCSAGEPLQHQIALLTGARVVLMSGSVAEITAAIRHTGALSGDPIARRLIARVGGAPAITLASGPSFCGDLTVALGHLTDTPAALKKRLESHPAGAPYLGLAFGVRFTPKAASATLAVAYPDAATAHAATGRMANAIATETSVAAPEPYATLLKVGATSVAGNDGLIELTAPKPPLQIEQLWDRRDLAFARC